MFNVQERIGDVIDRTHVHKSGSHWCSVLICGHFLIVPGSTFLTVCQKYASNASHLLKISTAWVTT